MQQRIDLDALEAALAKATPGPMDCIALAHNAIPALIAELRELREDADRARWCEEMRADVRWNPVRKTWAPQWWKDGVLNQVSHPDRSAAIDAARGVK